MAQHTREYSKRGRWVLCCVYDPVYNVSDIGYKYYGIDKSGHKFSVYCRVPYQELSATEIIQLLAYEEME